MRISSGGAVLKSPGDLSTFWMNSEKVSCCSICRGLMSCQTMMNAKIIITQTSTVLWLLRTRVPYHDVVVQILTPKGWSSTRHAHLEPFAGLRVGTSGFRRAQPRHE